MAPALSDANPVDAYASQVLAGEVPAGKYHRLACARHLVDRAREQTPGFPYVFLWDRAEKFLKFARLMKHYQGRQFAGKPFEPSPNQVFRLGALFGWRHVETGYRRFTTAYNEIPRKNGKTYEEAIVAVYATFFEGEAGAQGYNIATKEKQAKIAFNNSKKLVVSSGLSSRIKVNASNLHRVATECRLEPLGSDSDTTDGLNPHFIGVDEFHAFKRRDLLDVMESATGARVNPLIFQITTAGDDLNSPCGDQHDYACRILDGVLEDDPSTLAFFAFIAHADVARVETLSPISSLREMVKLCSCQESESAALRLARLNATLNGRTSATGSASSAIRSGSSSRTPSTTSDRSGRFESGPRGIESEFERTSAAGAPRTSNGCEPPADDTTSSEPLGSRSNSTTRFEINNVGAAESAIRSGHGSPSTTATSRDAFEDFSAKSATPASAFLEIVRREFDAHSSTCVVRKIARLNNAGDLIVSYPEDDPFAESTWRKANPNYGISVLADDIQKLAAKAQKMPAAAAEFKQKRLNIWVNAQAACLSLEDWRAGQTAWDEAALEGQSCWAGVDLASKLDFCALTLAFPPTATRPTWRWIQRIWTPKETLLDRAHRDRAPYGVWADQGWLRTRPGKQIDKEQAVREELALLRKRFRIEDIGFDPWHVDTLADQLRDQDGFAADKLVGVPQTFAGMSSACLYVQAEILDSRIDARGCPVTALAVANAVANTDGKDNLMFAKGRSRGRIDPLISGTIATARWLRRPEAKPRKGPRGVGKIWTPNGFIRVLEEDHGDAAAAPA